MKYAPRLAARSEPGADEVGPLDQPVCESREKVLLDDVGLALLHALEAIRDPEPVADLVRPVLDEREPVESANQAAIRAAVSAAPERSRRPGGVSARNAAVVAKHAAIPASSWAAIASTSLVPTACVTAWSLVRQPATG